MSTGTKLQVIGLTEIELLELEEECPDLTMHRSPAAGPQKTQHGDLGLTVAVVVVMAAAVQGLAVWLAKRMVEDFTTSEVSVEKLPDGTLRINATQMSRGKLSESPDAGVVRALKAQLSDLLQVDTKP
jgi:hypothetical protein